MTLPKVLATEEPLQRGCLDGDSMGTLGADMDWDLNLI